MRLRMGHGHKYAEFSVLLTLMMALVLTMILCVLPASAASQVFQRVRIANLPDSVQVEVHGTKPIAVHASRLGNYYLVFDLYGMLGKGQQKQQAINSGGVKVVRCGWYKSNPPIVRIVVQTTGYRKYGVSYSDAKRVAVISVTKQKTTCAVKSGSHSAASGTQTPVTSVGMVAAETRTDKVLTNKEKPTNVVDSPAVQEPPESAAEVQFSSAEVASTPANNEPVLVASTQPVITADALPKSESPAPKQEQRITLDFVGTDIHDVLKALSTESGINVVASPDVKGQVTVALNNVTVPEALRLVTNLSGYKYAQVENAYVVGTAENLKALSATGIGQEKLTEVCIIKYAEPGMLTKMIEQQYNAVKVTSSAGDAKDEKDKVSAATVLVLTGPEADVVAAKSFVEKVEQSLAEKAASVVTELYEAKYADSSELAALVMAHVPGLRVTTGPGQGFKLQCPSSVAMGGGAGGSGQGSNNYGQAYMDALKAPSKVLVMEGTAEEIEKAKAFLAKVDVQQPQIVIEAKVVDLTNEAASDLGIEWTWPGNAGTAGGIKFSEIRYGPEGEPSTLNALGNFRRVETEIMSKISALVKDGKGKILATPNVTALDGIPASIFIGDEVKYVVQVQETQSGINVTTETAKVGVQLHTIARISTDGYITMNLHPEVSMITDWLQAAGGVTLPEVSRRFVDSTIRVKDGETIVIGGLIKDEEIEKISGVPFLKDLPVLGELFKNRSKNKQRSEIMMFITPRVLKPS